MRHDLSLRFLSRIDLDLRSVSVLMHIRLVEPCFLLVYSLIHVFLVQSLVVNHLSILMDGRLRVAHMRLGGLVVLAETGFEVFFLLLLLELILNSPQVLPFLLLLLSNRLRVFRVVLIDQANHWPCEYSHLALLRIPLHPIGHLARRLLHLLRLNAGSHASRHGTVLLRPEHHIVVDYTCIAQWVRI